MHAEDSFDDIKHVSAWHFLKRYFDEIDTTEQLEELVIGKSLDQLILEIIRMHNRKKGGDKVQTFQTVTFGKDVIAFWDQFLEAWNKVVVRYIDKETSER